MLPYCLLCGGSPFDIYEFEFITQNNIVKSEKMVDLFQNTTAILIYDPAAIFERMLICEIRWQLFSKKTKKQKNIVISIC